MTKRKRPWKWFFSLCVSIFFSFCLIDQIWWSAFRFSCQQQNEIKTLCFTFDWFLFRYLRWSPDTHPINVKCQIDGVCMLSIDIHWSLISGCLVVVVCVDKLLEIFFFCKTFLNHLSYKMNWNNEYNWFSCFSFISFHHHHHHHNYLQ